MTASPPDLRIAFVTTCRGRVQHIEQTLPRNLSDNENYSNLVFVILNYNSPDRLLDYLVTRHKPALKSGRLVVYSHPADGPFHMAHAKNMAMRCAILEQADILVTMDADNFSEKGFARYIADEFAKHPTGHFLCPDFAKIMAGPIGDRPPRGYAGRLAIRTQDFVKAGGYDEKFDTWRGEDMDMIARLTRMGYKQSSIPNQFLSAVRHGADVRFKEYPHARQFENKYEMRIIQSGTDTVVNFGRMGVGEVLRNFDPTPIELNPIPTRIFGIGMPKTATNSLDKAFQLLGFDSLHWGTGEAPRIWNEMTTEGRSKTLEQFYALSDLPIPLLYKQLDVAYPGSKFVLTVRDENKWLLSVERMFDSRYNPTKWTWDKWPFSNRIHKILYGRTDFNRSVFLERYRRHNQEVMNYFRYRPEDLLVMDMEQGAGWKELCGFLRVPAPSVPYPTEYATKLLGV